MEESKDYTSASEVASVVSEDVANVPPRADLERLGRQRPEAFSSALAEVGFCASIMMSVLMADYFVSGFHTILPVLAVALDIPSASRTWPASVLSLVAGAFLLPLGRLADMYGGYAIFNGGFLWLSLWSLVSGFSTSPNVLVVCRAMTGLGAAAVLPIGVMFLGRAYRPGPRKNRVLSMYGAVAPVGFFLGIFIGGLAHETLDWRWYFWLGSAASLAGSVLSLVSIPRDFAQAKAEARRSGLTMDWWGAATIVPGLLLIVFAITDSNHAPQGWATPYILVSFVVGVVCLCAAAYIEGWAAVAPLIPRGVFSAKYMGLMVLSLFVSYGVFGIFLFYASFYIELVLEVSPLTTALWFVPWAVGGLVLAATSGFLMHLVPGKLLLVFCGLSQVAAVLLFALMPENPSYWAFIFPAMVAETACVDILYTVSNIFITTHLPSHQQGFAGALINCTLFLGICFFLGVADLAVERTTHLGLSGSYKVAFWIGVGFSGLALAMFAFMDIGFAKSDLTHDEKTRLEAGLSENSSHEQILRLEK